MTRWVLLVSAALLLSTCSAHPAPQSSLPEGAATTKRKPEKRKPAKTGPLPAGTLSIRELRLLRQSSRRQVMVTLRSPTAETVSRALAELETVYRLQTLAAWEMTSLGVHCVIFLSRADKPLPLLIRQLQHDSRIDLAQPMQWFETLSEQEDPYRSLQTSADALHLRQAHRLATGRNVKVAVIDTGVDLEHPDLQGQVSVARDFVARDQDDLEQEGLGPNLHGTAVAGIIAATAGNGLGIVGVAPEAKVMALKACWPIGREEARAACTSYTLALALDFAVSHGAQVINLSLAGPEDAILGTLLDAAQARGVIVIAAASGPALPFPASVASVLAVETLSTELPSDPPPAGTLTAPGTDVLTTIPQASYDFLSGASFAAAHAAGVAALLLEHRPQLKPEEVRQLLLGNAGLNALASVEAALALPSSR